MALHPKFPKSPYEILDPAIRWFPADESLRETGYGKLLPPLVAELRKKVNFHMSGKDEKQKLEELLDDLTGDKK